MIHKIFSFIAVVAFTTPCFAQSQADIDLYAAGMPIPMIEGPFFTPGSPLKPDARPDVTTVTPNWPDIHMTGHVTDLNGAVIAGLKIDFWQTDDQGAYDNSGGYDLRGHVFTDASGNYDYWTVMPANYEQVRTRHIHVQIGGGNIGYDSPAYTTQFYWPTPYDADIDADGNVDLIIEDGVQTNLPAINNADDEFIELGYQAVGADFAAVSANIFTINNNPIADGFFDGTLDLSMSSEFQNDQTNSADFNGSGTVDAADYTVWQNNFGTQTGATLVSGDADTDGDVDGNDFLVWQQQFGPVGSLSAVPEPSTFAIAVLGLLGLGCKRRNRA